MTPPNTRPTVAEKGNVVSRVSTSGSLQAVVTVDVGSQVSGRIQELYADFNSPVKKGELIAKIDPSLFEAAVVQAEANVTAARANVTRLTVTAEDAERQAKRAAEVFAQRLISETERDNAVATARAARASVDQGVGQLAQSRAQLETGADQPALHRHPVAHRRRGDLARGERGPDGGRVVVGAGHLHHRAGSAEDGGAHQRRRVRHRPAQDRHARVSFTVDAYPGEPFRGSIRDIRNAPQVVQNVVTYDAVIDVANPDLKLKPGMTATVSIVTDRRRDVLSVPNTALRFRPEGASPAGAARQRRRGSARRPAPVSAASA